MKTHSTRITAIATFLAFAQYGSHSSAFSISTKNVRTLNSAVASGSGSMPVLEKRTTTKQNGMHMFLQGSSKKPLSKTSDESSTKKSNQRIRKRDTTNIGDLVVPSAGIGTISWSSSSLTTLKNLELQLLVKEAYSSEAALFDTAERYGSHFKTALGLGWGETEILLQKTIKTAKAGETSSSKISNPIVATKFTPSPWRQTVQSVVDACEESRERLGVDQIDLYQLHMPDIVQPLRKFGFGSSKDEIYWEGLAECYKRGLVKNVGVCNYGPTLMEKCQKALAKHGVPLASNQIAYSLIGRHNGAQETVDKCSELGVKVLAYYPFAMGLLTGKYSTASLASLDDSVLTSTTSKKTSLETKDLMKYASEMGPLLAVMEDIAKKRGKSIAQIALNYVICKGAIPIPGAGNVSQLRDNIGAMNWRLSKAEVKELERESDDLGFGFEGAGFKRTSEKFVGYGVEKWSLD